ncbi:PRC-barrel domain-containing protein [Candidatus Nitrosotenuis cloacae]|uniref:PRC-barrel domain-containing protein n=1 Tax=Candidatus Nitrosotenuis cloacae TaxID=1603555 RepID=UPI002280988D|nr:PRC-barrel domain-containing protein [Candidatus Nitrosotenuis cloacae]
MSSELRLKKLRGSGGYVMAQVTDEQQRKGNLGGPDLFLAPIGRLEQEKISKYYCNTCEKDFEGGPKIEYESPNEEVAQNLILLERGQYMCTTCGSTIAEYREFQKQDQQADVGLAKPTTFEQVASVDPAPQDFAQTVAPVSTPAPASQSGSVNSIVGMIVYDTNAKRVGIAKQVGVDTSHQVVLIVAGNDGRDVTIPWNNIKKIGEIVLLGDGPQSGQASQAKCVSCGFENKQGSKFCESCGTKI